MYKIRRTALAAGVWCCAAWGAAAGAATRTPQASEFVAGPKVRQMSWSPTGQYLMAARVPAEDGDGESSLVLWNAERKEAKRLLWTSRETEYWDIQWLPRSNTALVAIPAPDRSTSGIWRVDARRAAATKLGDVAGRSYIAVSPTRAAAALFGVRDGRAFARRITPEAIGPEVALSETEADPVGWSENGATFYLAHAGPSEEDAAPLLRTFDVVTGAAGLARPPDIYGGPTVADPPFLLETTTLSTRAPDGKPVPPPWAPPLRPLWLLQQDAPVGSRIRIAADAEDYSISPGHDAVAWWGNTGGFVTPLVTRPTADLKRTQDEAVREDLLDRARAIGAAAGMYASEHDDQMPGGANSLRLLAPYLREASIASGFHYVFAGGGLSATAHPEQKVLGYFDGPGGRAVLYVDGRVAWEAQP